VSYFFCIDAEDSITVRIEAKDNLGKVLERCEDRGTYRRDGTLVLVDWVEGNPVCKGRNTFFRLDMSCEGKDTLNAFCKLRDKANGTAFNWDFSYQEPVSGTDPQLSDI
jgi:hypothetical protein